MPIPRFRVPLALGSILIVTLVISAAGQATSPPAQAEEQRLRAEVSELSAALVAEQGRWMDFNGRLDELERALTSR